MPDKNLKFHSADGKRKILLIEDEPINREILSMMLADSYDVLCAEDGARSLELLDAHCETLSLVLLDLNLPDMRGIDILRRIKASERMGLLPVIVMTADQEAEVECLSLGAIDFIPKPYPKQEVVRARILRTLRGPRHHPLHRAGSPNGPVQPGVLLSLRRPVRLVPSQYTHGRDRSEHQPFPYDQRALRTGVRR